MCCASAGQCPNLSIILTTMNCYLCELILILGTTCCTLTMCQLGALYTAPLSPPSLKGPHLPLLWVGYLRFLQLPVPICRESEVPGSLPLYSTLRVALSQCLGVWEDESPTLLSQVETNAEVQVTPQSSPEGSVPNCHPRTVPGMVPFLSFLSFPVLLSPTLLLFSSGNSSLISLLSTDAHLRVCFKGVCTTMHIPLNSIPSRGLL